MEKTGLFKLGYISNAMENKYLKALSAMVGAELKVADINSIVESLNFEIEYLSQGGEPMPEIEALAFRFKTPYTDKDGNQIYGYFKRNDLATNFRGVFWGTVDFLCAKKRINFRKYGLVHPLSWATLAEMTTIETISEQNIHNYVQTEFIYLNGAGYDKFPNGDKVTPEAAKFIKFGTSLKDKNGEYIIGWFTKNLKSSFEGINWGTECDFKKALKQRERFYVGRIIFDSIDECNDFLSKLKAKTLPEPWEYKKRKDNKVKYPILKSYLEFVLERLYWEKDEYQWEKKIVYNKDRTKILFNTNLIDKYGHDLFVVGDISSTLGKEYIEKLAISPSMIDLKRYGFESSCDAVPPKFFNDINEIVFHSDWDVEPNMVKYEHIVEARIERFPEKYRELGTDDLGMKLDNAIKFAKRIAQRNYKFIVPMYYPAFRRIQLLMPIYLETSYSAHPDFALVLTPHPDPEKNTGFYTPETILGLDEVYQDARLIAKPEESWLNPEMIE